MAEGMGGKSPLTLQQLQAMYDLGCRPCTPSWCRFHIVPRSGEGQSLELGCSSNHALHTC